MSRLWLVGLVVVAACGKSDAKTEAPGAPAGRAASPAAGGRGPGGPVPVEVAVATTDTVIDAITATGQIESLQAIELRPDVDGRIVEIFVREGSLVAKGAPLFKIDDVELKAQVARAEADRDLAEQALTRTRQLMSEKAAAQADVERAEASARSARAALELLQVRLDRTVVRAPWSGLSGARFVSIGDYVTQNSRLITLQTVNPQRAAFQVPERYAERLKVGQKVSFRVAALAGRDFLGTVDFVDPRVQLPARTITVKALAPNPGRELQAGMFIEARLETTRRANAVVVPEEAILQLPSGNVVWVVSGDQPERRPVELGVRRPGSVEVLSGVQAGDQVVIGGAERLNPQSKVRVAGAARPAGPDSTAASPPGATAAR